MPVSSDKTEIVMRKAVCEQLPKYHEVVNGKSRKQAFLTARGVFIKGNIYSLPAESAIKTKAGYVFGSGLLYLDG